MFARSGDVRNDALGVQAFVFGQLVETRNLRDKDAIRIGEGFWQIILEDRAARGVRAGLKERPQAGVAEFFAQSGQCFADRSGVVSEIIDNGDAIHCAPHFLTAAYALE